MIRWTMALMLAVTLPAAAAQRPSDSERQPVRVTTWVSRTAVWVGDPVELVVEFSLPPNVEVIADDLAREKLKLEGLEVVTTAVERETAADGVVTSRFRYGLASYEIAAPTLRVGAWSVRYYIRRAGDRPEDARPAGEVQVPGVVIARRSTLPDDVTNLDLRASGSPAAVPPPIRAARGVGIGLIVLAAAPLAIWSTVMVARWRSRVRRPRASVARAQARSTLEDLRGLDPTSEGERREAYGRLERAVRQHLANTRGIPADALVAGEIAARLQAAESRHADAAGELLAECERARYGPPDRVPPKERFGAALDTAERIFADARS